jgi:ABC-type multidrug transport system fused ATPase/permease subunit
MSGTLRENLQLGKPDATDEEMRHALHVAVADFVMLLPDGLDSRCGEGGVGLSEGQAQRIAIARGLLRPGSILLLDEPTSSLDSETEQILLSRLAAEVHRRTVIVVTHREQVVELCQERCYLTRNS